MRGSCLCGAVAYAAEVPTLLIGHSACRTCRKADAAPFTATARVPRENFRWLAGEEKLSSFESSPGENRPLLLGLRLAPDRRAPGRAGCHLACRHARRRPGEEARDPYLSFHKVLWLA